MFEVFDHTADLGLRIEADTFEQLLCEAGRGLFSMIVANLDSIQPLQTYKIVVPFEGGDDEKHLLLFDWLNELLFYFETEHRLCSRFDIEWKEDELLCICYGETMDVHRHPMDHEVKAITYHGLWVNQLDETSKWQAEVIVDI